MTTISAKIIADSIANDVRLTTLELCYPRFIHPEFMTHRVFSRNAQSTRAIPFSKMCKYMLEDPVVPIHWGANEPGMQAYEEIRFKSDAELLWKKALGTTHFYAKLLADLGLHKQIVNRLLEPFQHIKVVATTTEVSNFFKLRLANDVEPHMRELARIMYATIEEAKPVKLNPGEWHLPYVTEAHKHLPIDKQLKISVAKCARVSYLNHDNTEVSIEKDLELYDKLLASCHMSPFEHQATPMEPDSVYYSLGMTHIDRNNICWSNNFRKWAQYRAILNND